MKKAKPCFIVSSVLLLLGVTFTAIVFWGRPSWLPAPGQLQLLGWLYSILTLWSFLAGLLLYAASREASRPLPMPFYVAGGLPGILFYGVCFRLIGGQIYADGILRDEYWLHIDHANFWAGTGQLLAFGTAGVLAFFSAVFIFTRWKPKAARFFILVIALGMPFMAAAVTQYELYHWQVLARAAAVVL